MATCVKLKKDNRERTQEHRDKLLRLVRKMMFSDQIYSGTAALRRKRLQSPLGTSGIPRPTTPNHSDSNNDVDSIFSRTAAP